MWSKSNRGTCAAHLQITTNLQTFLVTINILCLSLLVIFICLQSASFYCCVGLLIDSAETGVRWRHAAFHAEKGGHPLF